MWEPQRQGGTPPLRGLKDASVYRRLETTVAVVELEEDPSDALWTTAATAMEVMTIPTRVLFILA